MPAREVAGRDERDRYLEKLGQRAGLGCGFMISPEAAAEQSQSL